MNKKEKNIKVKTLDIHQLFSQAWSIYKKNWVSFILIGIIFLIAGTISHGGGVNIQNGNISIPNGMIFYKLLGSLVMTYLEIGYIRYLFKLLNKQKTKVQDIFYGVDSLGHFAYVYLVNILVGIITGFGILLFIIPGIIAALGLMFAKYIIIENDGGSVEVVDAIKKSWKIAKGKKWRLLWISIVLGVVNLFGVLLFFLGLIVTIPLSALVLAGIYLQLKEEDKTE